MERRKAFRGLCFPKAGNMLRPTVTKARLSALRLPSKSRGGKLKAQLARRREDAKSWLFEILISHERESSWLPGCNECCPNATSEEHLADNPAGPCARRYLATPLHEIIPS
jgi:hypothetical protein